MNESFPHFDDFALIIGKDNAIGSDCRTLGEMIEELNREVENGEAKIFENNFENTEAIEVNDDDTTATIPSPQSTRRKRKTSKIGDNLMESLWDNINKFSEVYALSAEILDIVPSVFKLKL